MANAKVGSAASYTGNVVETITAVKTLSHSDSGKIFDVTAGDFAINLPQATANNVGLNYRFIITTGSTSALTIDSYEANDLYYGGLVSVTGIVASTSNATNGRFYQPDGSDDNTLTLDNNLGGNGLDKGSDFTFTCIAENKWWVGGYVMISAAEDDQTDIAPFS